MVRGQIWCGVSIRCFENACDFIYQVYQLSVNNFCNNRLFNQFALEDLAELLRVRIVVFETNQPPSDDHERDSGVEVSLSRPRVRVFEPKTCQNSSQILNDSVFIKLDHLEKIKFKWLMPTRLQFNLEKSRLLSSSWSNSNFFKLKPGYIRYRILLDQESLRQRFDAEFINNSVNFALFLRFVSLRKQLPTHINLSLNLKGFCVSARFIRSSHWTSWNSSGSFKPKTRHNSSTIWINFGAKSISVWRRSSIRSSLITSSRYIFMWYNMNLI